MNDDDGVSDRPTAADAVMEHVVYHAYVQFMADRLVVIRVHNEFSVHVGIFFLFFRNSYTN